MIWEQIRGAISGVGAGLPTGKRGTLKILDEEDLIDSSTVSCVSGKYNVIGTYEITPQTSLRCGFGRTGVVNEQIGLLYMLLKDNQTTPVEIPCEIRIAIVDAEDRVRGYVVHSVRNDKLSVDKTDLLVGFKFPEQGIEARPYDKVQVSINPDSDVTLVKANSDIRLDATLYA